MTTPRTSPADPTRVISGGSVPVTDVPRQALLIATFPDGHTEQLFCDLVRTETDTHKATVTQHPVEKGANVADHIRPEAEQLRLELVLTNSPLAHAYTDGRSAEIRHDVLIAWQNAGAVVALTTTLGYRDKLAIENISVKRDAKTGGPYGQTGGLRITLALRQIRIVQNKLTQFTVRKRTKDKRPTHKTPGGGQGGNVPSPGTAKNASTTVKDGRQCICG